MPVHNAIASCRLAVRRRRRPPSPASALIERIRSSLIGEDALLDGPFGPKRMVYADYTASGRALTFIEDYVRHQVLPLYANTHTEASATGLQTTSLREDARQIIHRAVNGGHDDVVIFCGSGTTGAIDKLIRLLELDEHHQPVVFIGPYEHHSNELPWRESVADVVTIREAAAGGVDLDHLDDELRRHADRPMKIGSFSAASNVTGIISDVDAVSGLLREHGAFACWDYASAGPYLPIDMRDKDAVFLSPHKFVGGPGTPGVLVVKRALVRNRVPSVPGGGTILFVSPRGHSYHPEPSIREEGGTPAIVESIRAGLVFALKEAVGAAEIHRRESDLARRALKSWGANPRIEVLGNPDSERLAILTVGLRHPRGLLHANFVVAVLSDLFGIQARSGCFCAGPYLHRMYPIDDEWSQAMDEEVQAGHMGAKLAFTRLSFNYFVTDAVFEYILAAVHLIADEGHKLLALYRFDPETGLWHHRDRELAPALRLHDIGPALRAPSEPAVGAPERVLAEQLREARRVIAAAAATPPPAPERYPTTGEAFERVRWFPLPSDGLAQQR